MTDRHPKWQPVEPGTVIPAGQPYRIEWKLRTEYDSVLASERICHDHDMKALKGTAYFIDSSWRPPLELPTEPTWGIVVLSGPDFEVGRWMKSLSMPGCVCKHVRGSGNFSHHSRPLDFIPLTPEQVARIEAAR